MIVPFINLKQKTFSFQAMTIEKLINVVEEGISSRDDERMTYGETWRPVDLAPSLPQPPQSVSHQFVMRKVRRAILLTKALQHSRVLCWKRGVNSSPLCSNCNPRPIVQLLVFTSSN